MRKMNISVAKNYTDKTTNAIKTKWINIGSLVIGDDGKVFGEIESIPVGVTELKFNCFDRDEKPQQHNNAAQNAQYNSPQGYAPQQGQPQTQQPTYEYQDKNGRPVPPNQYGRR